MCHVTAHQLASKFANKATKESFRTRFHISCNVSSLSKGTVITGVIALPCHNGHLGENRGNRERNLSNAEKQR